MRTDVRQALRHIVHHPRLTAVAVVTLAIGIAVNAVAFSAGNALLFKKRAGFDVPGAGRVVVTGRLGGAEGLSIAESDRLAAATAGALRHGRRGADVARVAAVADRSLARQRHRAGRSSPPTPSAG